MSTFTTFFQIDEDLAALDQHCNHSHCSIEAVEGMQMGLIEQVAALACWVDKLEAHSGGQHLPIAELEQKVEEGEETLLKCAEALEMILVRACQYNKGTVASGSGIVEESLELEYALGDEEFRTPPLDLMMLVLECKLAGQALHV